MPIDPGALYARGLISDSAMQRLTPVSGDFPPGKTPPSKFLDYERRPPDLMGGAPALTRGRPEIVKNSAVRVGGKIYEGVTHLDAYNNALKENRLAYGPNWEEPSGSQRNLFTTSNGRVVDQREAIEISRNALGLDLPPSDGF